MRMTEERSHNFILSMAVAFIIIMAVGIIIVTAAALVDWKLS